MRKLIVLATVFALAVTGFIPSAQAQTVRVFVDGDAVRFDQPPVIIGGRVLVPLRGIFEKMGATVDWEPATRTVVAVRGTTVVELVIGRRVARVNDRSVTLDVPAMIVSARTLVPLRFISESLGATVQWQAATRTVLIFSGQAGVVPPPGPGPAPTPAATQITGTLVEVHRGDNPFIVVATTTGNVRLVVTPSTTITELNTTTNVGGSIGLAQLDVGQYVEVTVGANNSATSIRATFSEVFGRLDAISGRRILLTNGQSYTVADNALILIDGQRSNLGNLRSGMLLTLHINPGANLVFRVRAERVSGTGDVTRPRRPNITQPDPGDAIASPVAIRGTAQGADRVLVTMHTIFGIQIASGDANVRSGGSFSLSLAYNHLPRGTPYVITVIGVNRQGAQSEPDRVNVTQR